jgi:hypothetical protein
VIKLPAHLRTKRSRIATVMRAGDHCDYQSMLSLEWRKASARAVRDERPLRIWLQQQWRRGSLRARAHQARAALLQTARTVKLSAVST